MRRRKLLLALAASALSCISQSSTASSENVIKVGVIQPQSGDCATWGLPVTRAAQLWAEEINEAGGFEAGDGQTYQIDVQAFDNVCYAAGDELRAARRAVLDSGAHYLLQTYTPASRQSIASLTNEQEALVTSYGAGYLSAEYPFLLGGMTGSPASNMLVLNYILEENPQIKRVALMTSDTSFGQAGKAYMEAGIAPFKDRVEIVYNEAFDPNATSDMLGLLTPVIQAEPDLIFELGFPPSTKAVMVSTADQLGYTGFFGSETWDVSFFEQQGNLAQAAGRVFSGFGVDGAEPTFSPRAHEFYKKFVAKHGEAQWSPWASSAYASLGVFEVGWKESKSVTAKDVKDTLYALTEVDHPVFGKSAWGGVELFGVNHHLLTPMPIYGLTADGKPSLEGVMDVADWWSANAQTVLPALKAGGQVFAN